jgi:exodeoxyribonuclease VII large subunit
MRERFAGQDQRLARALTQRLAQAEHQHTAALRDLNALSPLAVLNRGYALVRAANGALLTSSANTAAGDTLHIRLASGALDATVTSKEP